MNKLPKPKNIVRITPADIGEMDLPYAGVYVLAYLGKVAYVGKAEDNLDDRIRTHMVVCTNMGRWLWRMQHEWANIRLDILEPPDNADGIRWLKQSEERLIKHFDPIFNTQFVD